MQEENIFSFDNFSLFSRVALRAALAGDHLQSYSDIKGIVHRSKKYYFLPNVS